MDLRLPDPLVRDWSRERLRLAAVLLLGGALLVAGPLTDPWGGRPWVEFVLATLILLFPGHAFFVRAVRLTMRARAERDTLVALATGILWVWSLSELIAGEGTTLFVETGLVPLIVLVGRAVESWAATRADPEALVPALRRPPPVQRLADKVAAALVLATLVMALGCGVGWTIYGASFEPSLDAAIAVLLIVSPAALVLATAEASITALGRARGLGVALTGGAVLARAARVNLLFTDKTGTLTLGRPRVVETRMAGDGPGEERVAAVVAALETGAEGATARALATWGIRHREVALEASDVEASPGEGVAGTVDGQRVLIGTARFLRMNGAAIPEELASRGEASHAYMALGERAVAVLLLEDQIRAGVAEQIALLRQLGIEIRVLSGDDARNVARVCEQLGIEHFESDLTPIDKRTRVEEACAGGRWVAVVGHGFADAPALQAADVGFAAGTGALMAVDAADATLSAGGLGGVGAVLELARRTRRIVAQNLSWAIFYNLVSVPLAAIGVIAPLPAAGVGTLAPLFVIFNGLRPRRLELGKPGAGVRTELRALFVSVGTDDPVRLDGIESRLRNLSGVRDVRLNRASRELEIRYDPGQVTAEFLGKMIAEAERRPRDAAE